MRQELFMDGDARVNSQIWYIMSYVLKKCLYDYRSWAAPHSPLSYIIWHWCFAPYHGRNHCNEWPFDVFPISHIAETSSYKGVSVTSILNNHNLVHDSQNCTLLIINGTEHIYNGIVNWSAVVLSLQVSFGPISWLMVSEIFPLRTRGRALSIAVLLNFAANAVVTFAFSPLQVCVL